MRRKKEKQMQPSIAPALCHEDKDPLFKNFMSSLRNYIIGGKPAKGIFPVFRINGFSK
jgi:hypothetical protein